MTKQWKAVTTALLVLGLVPLGALGQGTGESAPKKTVKMPEKVKKEIDDYVRGLKYDPRKVLAVSGEGSTSLVMKDRGAASKSYEADDQKLVICTTRRLSLEKNCEDVAILQPGAGVIFPGSLVKANAELVAGKAQRISALQGKAAKATLTINLPGLGDRRVVRVKNPTDANVSRAISQATDYWLDKVAKSPENPRGYTISSRQSMTLTTAYSEKQVALQLGINANSSWASASADLDMSFDTSSKKKVLYALYKQVFYTVSCDPPKRPSSLMGGKVTLADVKREMTAAEPPAFVQSVSYGRMFVLRIETSWQHTEADVKAALEATKAGTTVKGTMDAKYKAILADSSLTFTSLGGSATEASRVVNSKDPTALMKLIQENSEFTKTNPGEPIAYTVKFLKDNRVATMGYTTDFTQVDCKVYPSGYVNFTLDCGYVADCRVTWKEHVKDDRTGKWNLVNREWTWKGATSGRSRRCDLKPGASAVKVSAKVYVFIGTTSDLDLKPYEFDGAPRVTYKLTGTTLAAKAEAQFEK
jgi:thiol-activated cytolysin